MNRRIKILFVRPSKSSFIQKDLELLRKHFDVWVGEIFWIFLTIMDYSLFDHVSKLVVAKNKNS